MALDGLAALEEINIYAIDTKSIFLPVTTLILSLSKDAVEGCRRCRKPGPEPKPILRQAQDEVRGAAEVSSLRAVRQALERELGKTSRVDRGVAFVAALKARVRRDEGGAADKGYIDSLYDGRGSAPSD